MAASEKNGSAMFTTKAGLKQHLLASHGTLAEVNDLRQDVGKEFAPLAAFTVDEYTDAAAASPHHVVPGDESWAPFAIGGMTVNRD